MIFKIRRILFCTAIAVAVPAIASQDEAEKTPEQMAIEADKKLGYETINFDDFFLDAKKMVGKKVSILGIYSNKSDRFMSNYMAAVRWHSAKEIINGANIPLITENADGDSRLYMLNCNQKMPIGCPFVVRGTVNYLTVTNGFGASWKEYGIVVDSIR